MSFYDFARVVVHAAGRVLWRVHVDGSERVPASGALIIACNHVSLLGPPILGAFCPRKIHYMAKRELFEIPVFGSLIRALGAYPVDREHSAAGAIKRSIEVLREGEAIGIFPEGGRNPKGEVRARSGVALLASIARVPVLPAAIVGSGAAMRLAPISVIFGNPLQLNVSEKATHEDLANFTRSVMAEIRALASSAGEHA